MDTNEAQKLPYMSFQTFWTFVNDLAAQPLPPQIDRSLMESKSGSDKTNLTMALKTFGFISDDLSVNPILVSFAQLDDDQRKTMLAELVMSQYSAALEVSRSNGTEKQLADCFRDTYGIDAPDTRRKAITFFLHAARTAGLTLSPHFPATRGSSGSRPRKAPVRRRNTGDGGGNKASDSTSSAESKVISFEDAGSVTITVGVKWLALPPAKMVALRTYIDKIEALSDPEWAPEAGGSP